MTYGASRQMLQARQPGELKRANLKFFSSQLEKTPIAVNKVFLDLVIRAHTSGHVAILSTWYMSEKIDGHRYSPYCGQKKGNRTTMNDIKSSASILLSILLLAISSIGLAQTASVPPGNGDINNPWLISSVEHLLWVSDETAGGNDFAGEYFVQTQDIDASATSAWFPDGSGGFLGFPPIGPTNDDRFAGQYDGAGHYIEGLFINRPAQNRIGLFGNIDTTGHIANLGLVDVEIEGDVIVGAMVGVNRGLIERTFVTGVVTAQATMGGLAATNTAPGVIRDSYALVDVTSGYRAGGLVGHNLGGLIENVFAAGSVTDTSGSWPASFGGLIGENDEPGAVVTNGFWDTDTSGYPNADDGAGDQTQAQSGIVGLGTIGLQDFATFDGLWTIEGRANLPVGYPVLQWQIDQDFSADAPVWLIRVDGPPALPVPFAAPFTLWIMALMFGLLGWRVMVIRQR